MQSGKGDQGEKEKGKWKKKWGIEKGKGKDIPSSAEEGWMRD